MVIDGCFLIEFNITKHLGEREREIEINKEIEKQKESKSSINLDKTYVATSNS